MLNRIALIEQINTVADTLFPIKLDEVTALAKCWYGLTQDSNTTDKVRDVAKKFEYVTWNDKIAISTYAVYENPYTILAIDGSQIYPDKHMGFDCFLLNIASVEINYGIHNSHVCLKAHPHVFGPTKINSAHANVEDINTLRYFYELQALISASKKRLANQLYKIPVLALFDGTLSLWHVNNRKLDNISKKDIITLNKSLYENRIEHVGYISSPRSTEITRLLQWYSKEILKKPCEINYCTDSDLFEHVLNTGQATSWFITPQEAPYNQNNPTHTCFMYLHAGKEVVRLEAPAWIASNTEVSQVIIAIVLSQVEKGRGYPIGLSEAHERAIIKTADREFFYNYLWKIAKKHNTKPALSQKMSKKRMRGI